MDTLNTLFGKILAICACYFQFVTNVLQTFCRRISCNQLFLSQSLTLCKDWLIRLLNMDTCFLNLFYLLIHLINLQKNPIISNRLVCKNNPCFRNETVRFEDVPSSLLSHVIWLHSNLNNFPHSLQWGTSLMNGANKTTTTIWR